MSPARLRVMSRTTLKRVRRGGLEPSLAQTRRAVTNGSLLLTCRRSARPSSRRHDSWSHPAGWRLSAASAAASLPTYKLRARENKEHRFRGWSSLLRGTCAVGGAYLSSAPAPYHPCGPPHHPGAPVALRGHNEHHHNSNSSPRAVCSRRRFLRTRTLVLTSLHLLPFF